MPINVLDLILVYDYSKSRKKKETMKRIDWDAKTTKEKDLHMIPNYPNIFVFILPCQHQLTFLLIWIDFSSCSKYSNVKTNICFFRQQ